MLAASVGAIKTNLNYSGPRKNSPASLDNSPELVENFDKIEQMHEDVREELEGFYLIRDLSIQPNELEPTELSKPSEKKIQ